MYERDIPGWHKLDRISQAYLASLTSDENLVIGVESAQKRVELLLQPEQLPMKNKLRFR